MADAKISELLELTTTPANEDLLVIVDVDANPATTKKITYANAVPKPAILGSILNTDQSTGNVNGEWITFDFQIDYVSLLNGFIDRPTTTQFRTLVGGYYEITYSFYGVPSGNDQGAELRIIKNGVQTTLLGSLTRMSRSRADLTQGGVASKVFYVLLAANDYFELQAAPLNGSVITFQSFSSLTFELVTKA